MVPLLPSWMPLGLLKMVSIAISLFLFFIGLDIVLGGKLVKVLGHFMNKKVDVDSHVIAGLSNLRKNAEREVQVNHTLLDTGIRLIVSLLVLIASAMIFFMIAMRMR